jgi:hypothetical protein
MLSVDYAWPALAYRAAISGQGLVTFHNTAEAHKGVLSKKSRSMLIKTPIVVEPRLEFAFFTVMSR